MALVIPFTSDAARDPDLRLLLDGTFYRLAFAWSTTGEYWSLDLKRDDGTYLLRGLRITFGVNLLRQFVADDFPPGRLVAVDTTGQGDGGPGRLDLQRGRTQLVYLSASEVAGAA